MDKHLFDKTAVPAQMGPRFSRQYHSWVLDGRSYLYLVYVDTHGSTVDEMVAHASIGIENWHGIEACTDWNIFDLPRSDRSKLVQEFKDFLEANKWS